MGAKVIILANLYTYMFLNKDYTHSASTVTPSTKTPVCRRHLAKLWSLEKGNNMLIFA